MSDDSQLHVPPSFVALFVAPGRLKPSAARDVIAARYDYCEDLAHLLAEQAQATRWQLGITEADVLERVGRGLHGGEAGVDAAEAQWVLRRLAELLGWDWHAPPG